MGLRLAIHEGPSKTYATRENAVKALTTATAALAETLNYLICTTPEGRFFPVVLPREDQVQIAVNLAHQGFPAVRV